MMQSPADQVTTLIVDDHPDIRLLMRMVIQAAGSGVLVVGEAATGEQALALIDQLNPRVVVLDEMMPGISGLETAQRIRATRPNQMIILCSARTDDDLRRAAVDMGINACVSKDELPAMPLRILQVAAS